jgi:solute carrier family 10 (sodium/bile acid cotransporter), member 7
MSSFLSRHWFTLAIPSVIGASYVAPDYFRNGGALGFQDYKDYAVRTMFVCSGICIPGLGAFRSVMSQHTRNMLIQGTSLVFIPLAVAGTAPSFCAALGLPDSCVTGATFAACLPTTVGLSVALTRASGGSVLLATFHSALGNTVGPFVTPMTAALLVGFSSANTDPQDVFRKLASLILLPLGLGLGLRASRPVLFASLRANRIAGTVQQLCLLTILSNVFSSTFFKRQQQDALQSNSVDQSALPLSTVAKIGFMMAVYHTVFFLGAAALVATTPAIFGGAETCIASVFCATQKTAAMGLPMLDLLFAGRDDLDLLVAPLLMYHMYQIMFGAMMGPHLLRRLCTRR